MPTPAELQQNASTETQVAGNQGNTNGLQGKQASWNPFGKMLQDVADWMKGSKTGQAIGSFMNSSVGLGIGKATNLIVGGLSLQYGAIKGPIGSALGNIPGFLYINLGAGLLGKGLGGLFGSKKYEFNANTEALEQIGGDYMNYQKTLMDANGDKFKKSKWNNLMRKNQQMTNMAEDARDSLLIAANMSNTFAESYALKTNGDDMLFMHAAKNGGKLARVKRGKWKRKNKAFKEGGTIEWKPTYYEEEWKPTYYEVESFLHGGNIGIRTLEQLIEYAKLLNPRFIERMSEPVKSIEFTLDDGSKGTGTHYMEYSENDNGDYVYPRIQEMDDKSLKLLTSNEAYERSRKNKNGLQLNKGEGKIFTEGYKQGWPEFFKKFKEGGKTEESKEKPEESNLKSIIPEGALHAHKHHMEDDENITKKGIPVVDMDGQLQAEIEKDEIIFNLHLTNLLEELYKEFYEEGTTLKRKDELAIEAGKLITCDIMTNLDDRTGLVDKCLKGGKLDVA